MNIRQMVDTWSGLSSKNERPPTELKRGDQVVIRKDRGHGRQSTKEVLAGTIMSLEGKSAVVSIPRPGGMQLRTRIPVQQLSAVSEVFKRNRVHVNPAFRGSV